MDELNQEFERLYIESTWTQARVARELSLDPSVISRYRTGKAKPSLTVLGYFAAKLGQRLLVGSRETHGAVSNGHRFLEPYEADFLDTVQRFHPMQRREILRHLGAAMSAVIQPVTYGATSTPSRPIDPNSIPSPQVVSSMVAQVGKGVLPPQGKKKVRPEG